MSEMQHRGRRRPRRSTSARGRRSFSRTGSVTHSSEATKQLINDFFAQHTPRGPMPQNPVGQALFEHYYRLWREKDPDSYWLNQAMWEIAPYCPKGWEWLVNLTALGTVICGASRIVEHRA